MTQAAARRVCRVTHMYCLLASGTVVFLFRRQTTTGIQERKQNSR